MSIDTKALIAATPATVALVRRELDKSRESQRGGCGIPKAVNVDCAMVERLCRIAEKQADRLAELEAENGRLKPAEQHDPLAVSDHCPECSEPEPECVCGEQPAERESLPLMARREWMRRDTDYFVVHGDFCLEIKAFGRAPHYDEGGELLVCAEAGDSIEREQVDAEAQPDGIYRIADTDEHGLPVIERTADMPEDVTHMTLHTRRFFRAGELRARSVEGDEGLVRIEDYRPAAQESDQ